METLSIPSLSSCPNALDKDQIEQFQRDGYLAFSDVISPDQVERARQALSRITRELVTDPTADYKPAAPKENGNYSGARFKRASGLSSIQLEPGYNCEGRDLDEVELKVRKFMGFIEEDEVFPEILDQGTGLAGVVASLLGASPIMFQQMALVKPPFVGVEKPWHQDNAYFSVAPLDKVMGVWIALDDADVDNGCMHVIPGGHREGALRHHHGKDCEIDLELIAAERAVPVPVPAGGAMFFYGMLPHETPPNQSPKRRRALQFHFRGADTKVVDEEAYDRLFADRSGTPASCRAASRHGF